MDDSGKKYNIMEPTLQLINRKYISLKTPEVKVNNVLLERIIPQIIDAMKSLDSNFKALYESKFYGGSFYDDLKVGSPDEYDIDVLLVLPKKCESCWIRCDCVEIKTSNRPGYVWLKIQDKYSSFLAKYTDENKYLKTTKILNWMKSLVHRALNILDINVPFSESGPAITLHINGPCGRIDVDLVLCIKFDSSKWPSNGFRSNPTNKDSFFIVPKSPRGNYVQERYWRLSFQEQEKSILSGKEKLKPALRLLKKTRDNSGQFKISSYYLKTILLWEACESEGWRSYSLSYTYMHLLKKYRDCLKNQKITYFWNKNHNLLGDIRSDTLQNHCNRIERIISAIDDNLNDPFMVAKKILSPSEYNNLMDRDKEEIEEEVRNNSSCMLL